MEKPILGVENNISNDTVSLRPPQAGATECFRCPPQPTYRAAPLAWQTSRRQHLANSLAMFSSLAIGILLVATASMPASAEESHNHFVGPPSRLQPRLSNEMGTPRALTILS